MKNDVAIADNYEFAFGVTALNKLTEFPKESPEIAPKMFMDYLRKSIGKAN